MKKILIIGSGGAGKSTFSRRLSELTGIEVFHLDKLHWKPDWVEPSKDEWRKTVENLVEKDSWILDGNFGGTIDLRLKKCDTAILLDVPRTICFYRVLKRRLKYRGTNRPDMTEGCNEKVDLEFLGWIWNYPKKNKPQIEEKLKRYETEKCVIRLRSKRETENFFANYFKNSLLK